MIKLNKIITIIGGGTPSKLISHYWNGSIPWASVKDLRSDYIEKTIDSISLEAVSNSATQIIPKGSIIIGTRMAVGKVSINLVDLAINQDLKAIICSDKVFYKYLFYFFKSKEECLNSLASGATVKGIKLEHIKNLEIPLPPLATQKHIADILDAADALRRKTQQIVDSYDELAQSLFLEMFGDPVRNEKGWKLVGLETVCDDIFLGLTNKVDYVETGGYPLIRATDINGGKLSFENVKSISEKQHKKITKKHISKRGDILVSKSGTLGTTAIVDTDIEFTTYESIITIQLNGKRLSSHYLNFLLRNKNFQLKMIGGKTGGTVGHLNLLMFRGLILPLPPLDLQNQFAEKIALIEQQKELAKQSLAESENLFNALLQKAFKGELVPEPQPAEQAV